MSAGVLARFDLDAPIRAPRRQRFDWWRGAVAARFRDIPDFHGHSEDGALYRYPPVQYREVDERPAVFAMGPAMDALLAYPWPGEVLDLGGQERTIVQVSWEPVDLSVRACSGLRRYQFGAPWLPLNQVNYERFAEMAPAQRRAELDRILTGNLLTMCTGLGIRIETRILAAALPSRAIQCSLKDVVLQGFWGGFTTNLDLFDGLAIGKAVSRGFGWIIQDV